MHRHILIITILLFLFTAISYPENTQDTLNQIEQTILAKNWKGLYSILNTLPDKTFAEKEKKEKIMNISKSVSNLIRDYDMCMKMSDRRQIAKCLDDTLRFRFPNIPDKLPFSKKLVELVNETTKSALENSKNIKEQIAQDKMEAELERERKNQESKKRDEDWSEQMKLKAEINNNANDIFFAAQERAFESPEYKKLEISCSICDCMEKNRHSENKINEEKRYADKYGTINLSKIDGYKQKIIYCDRNIKEQKQNYKKIIGKIFNTSECQSVQLPCDDSLYDLRMKLIDSYIATEEESIRVIVRERYLKQ